MKFRNGFVTNSSSSSYICDISGRVESGYDLCLYEAEMYECENGHTFDERYFDIDNLKFEDIKECIMDEVKNKIIRIKRATTKEGKVSYDSLDEHQAELEHMMKSNNLEELKTDSPEILYDYKHYNEDKDLLDFFSEAFRYNDSIRYEVPEKLCPICSHRYILESESLKFALGKLGMTVEQLEDEIKENFKSRKYYYALDKLDMKPNELEDEIKENFKKLDK